MLYALVVIYNKRCEDSLTLQSITKNKRIKIIVFDNSEQKNDNQKYCKENEYTYYSLNKNVGLSKAYNYVINKINLKKKDYIMILDDDTKISKEYIEEVKSVISKEKYDVILPIVKSKNNIISPSNIQFGCRVNIVKNIDEINLEKITAINSGMVVKGNVYKKIKYNEKIFLDYVDHDFMESVRKEKIKVHILNSVLIQSFSRDEKKSLKSELTRFQIYKKDFYEYCKDKSILYYYINIFKYIIKLSLIYRKNIFIYEFFRKG